MMKVSSRSSPTQVFQVITILEFLGLGLISASAAEDVDFSGREALMTPPVRKRTQLRHKSERTKEKQVGEESLERFDPFIGIERDLQFDSSLSMPNPTMSPSLSFSMATNRPTFTSCPYECDRDEICAFSWPGFMPRCYPRCSNFPNNEGVCSTGDVCVYSTFVCETHADVMNEICECSAFEPDTTGNFLCRYSDCGLVGLINLTPAPSPSVTTSNSPSVIRPRETDNPTTSPPTTFADVQAGDYILGTDIPTTSTFIVGRPYVDSSGEMLKAMPIVPDMKKMNSMASVSWSGEVDVGGASISSSDNVTDHNRLSLGEEWTERGLAEHASVASFSAFSIALMTNNAPSDLIEDAFKAGMDEIRHARTSFEVATKLVGRPVGPGPLPPSTHKFGDDLTSLALAVAREGCVDETLSAIVADLEADDINRVLEEGTQDNIYSNIERDTLAWIKKEMQAIAKEESSHAALAWRTLNWVCDIDSDACEAVHRDVFDEASLELRFNQRAMNALSDMSLVRNKLSEDWAKLLEVHRLVRSNSDISHVKNSICDEPEGSSLIRGIPAAVLRGMIC